MTKPLKGWYLRPEYPGKEQFWDNGRWSPGRRRARVGTGPLPGTDAAYDQLNAGPRPTVSEGLRTAGAVVYLVAALIGIGAVAGGVGLIMHSIPASCDGYGCGASHPFRNVGWALLIGGVLQAFTVAVIGRLCTVVSEVRDAIRREAS